MIEEINPEHPVTSKLHAEWHKLLAVVMHKFNLGEVVITSRDITDMEHSFPEGMPCILAHDKKDGIHLSLITEEEARRKAVQ